MLKVERLRPLKLQTFEGTFEETFERTFKGTFKGDLQSLEGRDPSKVFSN